MYIPEHIHVVKKVNHLIYTLPLIYRIYYKFSVTFEMKLEKELKTDNFTKIQLFLLTWGIFL